MVGPGPGGRDVMTHVSDLEEQWFREKEQEVQTNLTWEQAWPVSGLEEQCLWRLEHEEVVGNVGAD